MDVNDQEEVNGSKLTGTRRPYVGSTNIHQLDIDRENDNAKTSNGDSCLSDDFEVLDGRVTL
jgi:hypothetical protein